MLRAKLIISVCVKSVLLLLCVKAKHKLSPNSLLRSFYIQNLTFMGKAFWHNTLFYLNMNWTLVIFQIFMGRYLTGSIKFSFVCLFCYICSRLVLTWNLQNSLFGLLAVKLTSPYFLPRYDYSRIFFKYDVRRTSDVSLHLVLIFATISVFPLTSGLFQNLKYKY